MGATRFFGLDALEWSVTLTGSVRGSGWINEEAGVVLWTGNQLRWRIDRACLIG